APSGITPVEVPNVLGATHVSVGVDHVCATTIDGKVWCWGHNDLQQLGRADPTSTAPASVDALSNVAAISAGRSFTCALTRANAVWCWGDNRKGQLGRGTVDAADSTGQAPAPTSALGPSSNINEIGAGLANEQSACARIGGGVYCWGSNLHGALGHDAGANGDRQSSSVCTQCNPTPMTSAIDGGAQGLGVGGHTNCASTPNGPVCWGLGAFAQLGSLDIDLLDHPQPSQFPIPGTTSVSMRDTHGCTIASDKSLRCWGTSFLGALGTGQTSDTTDGGCNGHVACDPNPEVVYNFSASVVTTGCDVTLAQSARDGTLWSWGRNDTGQLGRPTSQTCDRPSTTPLSCDPIPRPIVGLP
ncbi:MAG: hypothetical protein ABI551_23500, partial [Polyangiaceae bacterium]